MAKSKVSGLLAKLGTGAKKAFNEAKKKEVSYGNSLLEIPGGVSGTAQLVDIKLDTYKKGDNEGEYYFYAAASVVHPTVFEEENIKGRRTSIMEPLYDTPTRSRKTIQEHFDFVCNELKKLGVDIDGIEIEQLEDIMAAIKKSKPYIKFETSELPADPTRPDAKPFIYHRWSGVDEEFVPGVAVEDETEEVEEVEEKLSTKSKAKSKTKEPTVEDLDIDELVIACEELGDNEPTPRAIEAMDRMTVLALDAGIDNKKIDNADSWDDVRKMIEEAAKKKTTTKKAKEEPKEDEDTDIPEQGDVLEYAVLNKKTKKKVKKDVEVLRVDKKEKTVDLKDLDTEEEYEGVSWDELG